MRVEAQSAPAFAERGLLGNFTRPRGGGSIRIAGVKPDAKKFTPARGRIPSPFMGLQG